MNRIALLAVLAAPLLFSAEPREAAKPAKAAPALEFRLVSQENDSALPKVPVGDGKETVALEPTVLMDTRSVASAKVTLDANLRWQIELAATRDGAKTFAQITRKNVKRRLAMVSAGKVISAPTIQAEIPGGRAVITGSFTVKEARQIAKRINEAVAADKK